MSSFRVYGYSSSAAEPPAILSRLQAALGDLSPDSWEPPSSPKRDGEIIWRPKPPKQKLSDAERWQRKRDAAERARVRNAERYRDPEWRAKHIAAVAARRAAAQADKAWGGPKGRLHGRSGDS